MPNWCSNRLTVSHSDPAAIQRIQTAFNEKRLLNEFVPQPDPAIEANLDWYFWRLENWGTKWDVGGDDFVIEGYTQDKNHCLLLYFDSAWSPPLKVYEAMANLDYVIEATYYEPGIGFVGEWTSENGDEYYEFEMTAESIAELPEHLVDEYGIEPDEDESDDQDLEQELDEIRALEEAIPDHEDLDLPPHTD